ncbi:P-loop containing nucleoside triphosphate hydrolase protein [Phanerochaete sordida]|uniref:P-loop containing nucleoside triphosphate hydrolase protein n=1 Tax=Phanerochaete sordida TaxID=48140 RepID=A0A9P3G7Y0_9APHY|nr:P-loop containing nucleoside triphosphate hydrolase protein [Phanerochaete sordida]
MTIHQPRSEAFHLFDKILLLAQGAVVYCGSSGACLPYFSTLGYTPPGHSNPLDFLIDVCTVDVGDSSVEQACKVHLEPLTVSWAKYELAHSELGTAEIKIKGYAVDGGEGIVAHVGNASQTTKSLRQFGLGTFALASRASKNAYRAYQELFGHLLQGFTLGVLMGLTFFHLGEQPNDIQSLKTLSFQLVPVYGYVTQVIWTYRWCQLLVIFDREQEDHLYAPLSWVASEFLAWLPVNAVVPSIYVVLVYFISHLRMDSLPTNLGILVADFIMVQLSFVAWSLLAGSIVRDFASAAALGNSLSLFFLLSPGYFLVNVPAWISWFRWLSPHFYSYRIVVISQFRGRSFACVGVSGDALAQCYGANVLRGLRLSADEPIWPYFLGSTGFVIVTLAFSLCLLTFYHPGGIRHAPRAASAMKGKESQASEVDVKRDRVEVTAVNVRLRHASMDLRSFQGTEKTILDGVSARFSSGKLSVIMGPSGSGKSTFLRLCAGRSMKAGLFGASHTTGEILFNGLSSKHTRHLCAFVEQDDDHHLPALTVRETLRFAAMFKLPHTIGRKRKFARAEEVLKMLGLQDCADNMVGGELLKGISGGEKRRLSLACQMIDDPPVLIADEPTSGLDASTAKSVMEALRNLAQSGRTVIVSIHQPRSDIWNMCDNVTILAKGGRVAYHGQREDILPYLAAAGYNCPPLFNPADFAIDLVSASGGPSVTHASHTGDLAHLWNLRAADLKDAAIPSHDDPETPRIDGARPGRAQRTPTHIALPCLLDRMFRNTWRQGAAFRLRFVQPPLVGLAFLLFFLRLTKGPPGAQDRIGLVAECTSILSFVGFLNVVALYPAEKAAFFHDYTAAGARYSSASFLAAFTLFAIVPEVIAALCFTVLVNVATGMQTNARIFLEFAAAIWMQLNFGESVGIIVASFFDTMGLAVSLVSLFLTMAAQSSGIFSASVIPFLADIAWIFPVKYLPRILLINEMTGLEFDCSPESIQSGECIAATGDQVLETYGFHGSTTRLLFISLAITVAYRLLAWVLLEMRVRFIS